jgi:hypothetical protein
MGSARWNPWPSVTPSFRATSRHSRVSIPALAEADQRGQDEPGVVRGGRPSHELLIQLQHVERHPLEQGEGRVPLAEVVEGDPDPRVAQPSEEGQRAGRVFHAAALRHLEDDARRDASRVANRPEQPLREPLLGKLARRRIHGEEPLPVPARQREELIERLLDHVPSERIEHARVVRRAHEVGGRQEPDQRMVPAHEGLHADRFGCAQIVDRLVTREDPALPQRALHLLPEVDGGAGLRRLEHLSHPVRRLGLPGDVHDPETAKPREVADRIEHRPVEARDEHHRHATCLFREEAEGTWPDIVRRIHVEDDHLRVAGHVGPAKGLARLNGHTSVARLPRGIGDRPGDDRVALQQQETLRLHRTLPGQLASQLSLLTLRQTAPRRERSFFSVANPIRR